MKNSVCRDIKLGLPDRDAKVDCVMEEEDGESRQGKNICAACYSSEPRRTAY